MKITNIYLSFVIILISDTKAGAAIALSQSLLFYHVTSIIVLNLHFTASI